MKKEQLDGKFIICRTKEEYNFIQYWAKQLFDLDINVSFSPMTIRIGAQSHYAIGRWGWSDIGDYERDPLYGCKKE